MSLINDALKRAREAQQQQTPQPAPSLQLRPVEAQPPPSRGAKWLLPTVGGGLLVLGALLVWQATHRTATPKLQPASSASAPATQPVEPVQAVVAPQTKNQAAQVPAAAADDANTKSPEATAQPGNNLAADTNAPTVAVTEVAPSQPAPLRLQAIVFHPTRPSAIISGKSLFIGDKIAGLRVAAIGQESVTLTDAGQTNVLTLP
jgi:cytoskeletal protein RodZ